MTGAIGGILSAARLIREADVIHDFGDITRYQVSGGAYVDIVSGHEAEMLALADKRAAELATPMIQPCPQCSQPGAIRQYSITPPWLVWCAHCQALVALPAKG